MEFLKNLDTKIKVAIGIITLASMISVMGLNVYNVFAKEEAFQSLKQEYLVDKLTFRRNRVQERMWQYDDRYGKGFVNKTSIDKLTKDSYRKLEQEYKELSDQLTEKYSNGKTK